MPGAGAIHLIRYRGEFRGLLPFGSTFPSSDTFDAKMSFTTWIFSFLRMPMVFECALIIVALVALVLGT